MKQYVDSLLQNLGSYIYVEPRTRSIAHLDCSRGTHRGRHLLLLLWLHHDDLSAQLTPRCCGLEIA